MLEPQDKMVFDEMVTRLHAEDPTFVRRAEKLDRPRATTRVGFAVFLWALAPICIVFGGWTGTLLALAAIAWGTHLLLTGRTPTLTRTRPGASL